jgi:dCMP deaminase
MDEGECFRRSISWPEEIKYDMCRASHAEANAIALAAKKGFPTGGSTIYCTLEPCITCSKLIVIAGISRVVFEHAYESPMPERDEYWRKVLLDSHTQVEHLRVSGQTVDYAIGFLRPDTSRRRI